MNERIRELAKQTNTIGDWGEDITEGIYADEMRANAVCAELNEKSPQYESYKVFEYKIQE